MLTIRTGNLGLDSAHVDAACYERHRPPAALAGHAHPQAAVARAGVERGGRARLERERADDTGGGAEGDPWGRWSRDPPGGDGGCADEDEGDRDDGTPSRARRLDVPSWATLRIDRGVHAARP